MLYGALFRVVALQTIVILIVSLVISISLSMLAGLSILLGGAISIIPGYLFGRIFLKTTGANTSQKVLNSFYLGEAVKLFAAALLFFLAFQWQALQAALLFIGLITAQLVYWVVLCRTRF